MGEAAASSAGINPNVPVTGEGTAESKGNSDVSWDDVADVTEPRRGKKAPKAEDAGKPAWAKSSNAFDEADERKDGDHEEPDDDSTRPAKRDEDAHEDKGKKDAKKEGEKEPAKKPKVHKFRSGDSEHDLSGDAVVTIPVNGKKEDVPLQELVNHYNGKVAWDKRFNDLDKSEKAHQAATGQMTEMVTKLHDSATKDPETAWDFLADWTKQDPVALKEKILRQHISEILPLAKMDEKQREAWIQDQKRNWRDRAHTNRENAAKAQEQTTRAAAEKDQALKTYGIDDKAYDDAKDKLTRYLQDKDPKNVANIKTSHVIHAHRNLMALDVIRESVPHLANHEKFDSIVSDITSDLVKHPSITREKLANQLKDVFGEDNSRLRKLGKRAAQTAETDSSRRSNPPPSRSRSEAVTFDDL